MNAPSRLPSGPLLIDTSVWVEALRRAGHAGARREVLDALETGLAVTNGLVLTEILRGAAAHDALRLTELLDAVVLVPLRGSVWNTAAELGRRARSRGAMIPTVDLVIAASAIEQDCVVLHRDRHFQAIAEVSDLRERFIA